MFESGNRVQDTLADLADIMGARDGAVCREMTKLHEDIRRAPLAELARSAGTLETRGEFVLVIGPLPKDAQVMAEQELDELLRSQLLQGSVEFRRIIQGKHPMLETIFSRKLRDLCFVTTGKNWF